MADEAKSKIDEATEKAYAEASAGAFPKKSEAPTAAEAAPVESPLEYKAAPKPAIATAAKKTVAKKPASKARLKTAAAKKAVAKNTAAKKAPVKQKTPARKVAPKKAAARKSASATPISTLTELKETIMAKTNTKDFTKTIKETAADVQARMKTAYDKGSEYVSEAAEFNKANIEAMVESGKVLAGGVQEMAREGVEDTKTVWETMTADAKKMAAVKSPTELFQLQGDLARRNFDAMIAYGSKNAEKMIKLANDAFAPVSNRMSVAAEKISKAA